MSDDNPKEYTELYKKFKRVSIAEFFEKNRHLLGFDSLRKALLISVKELVDNSLDACEEARVLPDIYVEIIRMSKDVFKVVVEDNGPGIPYEKVPEIYGSFLFGTKFHRYVCTRGKQGIGASAITLYSQLTTRRPIEVITKTPDSDKAIKHKIKINVKDNTPLVEERKYISWNKKSGTSVTVYIKSQYVKGRQSVDEYIELTALANPHARITYINPDGEMFEYKRISNIVPELKEIRPHPHGIEIGSFERMLKDTKYSNIKRFLMKEFYGIGNKTALEILRKAGLSEDTDPRKLSFDEIEKLYEVLQEAKVKAIPSKYITTMGKDNIIRSLTYLYDPDFVTAYVRRPAVYKGNSFIVEVGVAYGGRIDEFKIIRYANRVPLLYKSGECAITNAIEGINLKNYGLTLEEGKVKDPLIIMVHIASVWIPFTSESKEAIAPYPEIIREIELGVKKVLRELEIFLNKKKSLESIGEKYKTLYGYGMELSKYLGDLLEISESSVREKVINRIREELTTDIEEIIKGIREVRRLIREGKIDSAKAFIRKLLKDVIETKVMSKEELDTLIENVIKKFEEKKLLEIEK
ncbi:DNA topoisomerase VI subunit B [Nanoarchaeota archaeon NZ13-N]|nr:MAG: DNA topoisomerase VI subunit B [Nanoarchaeota archaeon NZ13-N]